MWVMLAGVPGKLKALTDRLTAGRAAKLDHLDADVSSRAPASTALSDAVWTPGRAAALDLITALPGSVKSVQRGALSFAEGPIVITIDAVQIGRSLVFVQGNFSRYSTSASAGWSATAEIRDANRQPFGVLQSPTELVLRDSSGRDGSGNYFTGAWTVVEFR